MSAVNALELRTVESLPKFNRAGYALCTCLEEEHLIILCLSVGHVPPLGMNVGYKQQKALSML